MNIDSKDVFMTGHSVRAGGQGSVASAKRRSSSPRWTQTDAGIRKVIRLAFPHFETNEHQRKLAARWARVIYLYFRTGYTYSQIAEEMKLFSKAPGRPYSIVENLIEHILKAAEGRSANGSGLHRKRGRHHKNRDVSRAVSGGEQNGTRSDSQGPLLLPTASRRAAGPRKVQLP